METLGSLIDKLSITQLKHLHSDTDSKKESTKYQVGLLSSEINEYLAAALRGDIKELTFDQNKIYKQHTIEVGDPSDSMEFGELVSKLVRVNQLMWKNQEIVYNFKDVPEDERVDLINRCATLNIERNKFVSAIDVWFLNALTRGLKE